jgi:hypothetical protein
MDTKDATNSETDITQILLTVAENEAYEIYLKGCYNFAGFGDSKVSLRVKKRIVESAHATIAVTKFSFNQFYPFGWLHPALDKDAIKEFLNAHSAEIAAAQKAFIERYRSKQDKIWSEAMDTIASDNLEFLEDNF